MNKKISALIAVLGLTLASCASLEESLVEKSAMGQKLKNRLAYRAKEIDDKELKKANKKVDNVLANKSDLAHELKEACEPDELKKLDTFGSCVIEELEKHVKARTKPADKDELRKTCKDEDLKLSTKCQKVVTEIAGKLE